MTQEDKNDPPKRKPSKQTTESILTVNFYKIKEKLNTLKKKNNNVFQEKVIQNYFHQNIKFNLKDTKKIHTIVA